MNLIDKLEDLKKRIAEKEAILVSFSGGVDSSLLAKVATDVLDKNVLCVIIDSETLARNELRQAEKLARSLDLNLYIVKLSMLAEDEFVQNSPTRCYLCKKACSRVLKKIAAKKEIDCIADGLNLSDYQDYRPGISACTEEGIWHPFIETGISKKDIREIARIMSLPFWNKPSSACLSSRIPYYDRITEENLMMVESAEDYLTSCGFGQLRLRAHGKLARIELLKEDKEKALNKSEDITGRLKAIGFKYITLDLEGFRSGSMNEVLKTGKKY